MLMVRVFGVPDGWRRRDDERKNVTPHNIALLIFDAIIDIPMGVDQILQSDNGRLLDC